MIIQIVSDSEYLVVSGDEPDIGRMYALTEAEKGSGEQNRAFHALVGEYWKSGAWSYPGSGYRPGMTLSEFRSVIKLNLGAGFSSYDYADIGADGLVCMHLAVQRDDIPAHVWERRRFAVRGNLKSWSRYTKKERTEAIDNVITEMLQVGVNTKKFHEILRGMEEGKTA